MQKFFASLVFVMLTACTTGFGSGSNGGAIAGLAAEVSGGLLIPASGGPAIQYDDFNAPVPKATTATMRSPGVRQSNSSSVAICEEGAPPIIGGTQYCLIGIHR